MNKIFLRGSIRNIRPSHKINDVDFDQADIITKRKDGREDILTVKFKRFSNFYRENDLVELVGNIRSFSKQVNGKNKVDIYTFTYFDKQEDFIEPNNLVEIDGRICKMEDLRVLSNGKHNIHFILANNLLLKEQKLNSYIPCIAWGRTAKAISNLSVNDVISIKGELHSREYKKVLDDGSVEFRVAHELYVEEFTVKDASEF